MGTMQKVLLVLTSIVVDSLVVDARFLNVADNTTCLKSAHDFYKLMGSRTPYTFVHGKITKKPPGCEPLLMWMTARHGTRFPDTMTLMKMLELEELKDEIFLNHDQGRGKLCKRDLDKLRAWRRNPDFYEGRNGTLAYEGRKELHLLARRLKESFPEILGSNEQKDYSFITTSEERATSSLTAFASSLLNISEAEINVEHENIQDAKSCPRWLANWDPKIVYAEEGKFKAGPEVREMRRRLSNRLGFVQPINARAVRTMYEVCRYETALNPPEPGANVDNINIWCQMFNKDDLIVAEYTADLDYYYSSGPGNKMSSKINCGIFKKLFDNFARVENGEQAPKALFTFGHSTNVQSIMSQLRIYEKEPPMLASNYAQMQNRIYRLSKMGPFCANVAAVFYKCNDPKSPYKVTFHNSENEISPPGCDGAVCDWEYLKSEFGSVLDTCDPNFCDLPNSSTSGETSGGIVIYDNTISLILTVFVILSFISDSHT